MLASHDAGDILNLIDGLAELVHQLAQAAEDVKKSVIGEFGALLKSPDIAYAVKTPIREDVSWEPLISKYIDRLCDAKIMESILLFLSSMSAMDNKYAE